MKLLMITAFILVSGFGIAGASSLDADAKRELEGWGRAAARYEQTCNAGKLRQQMPQNKAVDAYECFAKIIDEEVTFQYPDLYETLNNAMKEAHYAYGAGEADWDATLIKLQDASDTFNAAVARRNASSGNN
jgi:hypothetical protein